LKGRAEGGGEERMPGKDEIVAAGLLEEYMAAVQRGEKPDVDSLIQRCPLSEQEGLRLAVSGTDFLSANWEEMLAPPRVVEEGLRRIAALKEKSRLLDQARARLGESLVTEPLVANGVLDFLSRVLGSRIDSAGAMPAASAAGVMFRGGSSKPLPRRESQRASLAVFAEAAARQARKLWLRLGSPAPPIDPRLVAEALGVLLIEKDVEGGDGCIAIQGDVAAVLVNAAVTPEGRKRFTIAHELGHFELHRSWLRFRTELTRDMECVTGAQEELEANAFASELLMPTDLVAQEFAHQRPSFASIDAIVGRYLVSITAAARRLVDLSDYGCALLCISEGVVKWCCRSEDFPYWLQTGTRPPADSDAASLLNGDETDDKPWQTDIEWWTEEGPVGGTAQVWEHSRLLYDDYVLTLLCLGEE
jgi:Zn-dependent peptidase ImmA (M78 family)